MNHGSEPNSTEQPSEFITISFDISAPFSVVMVRSVQAFQQFFTFTLNVYNCLVVIMISQVNEGAGGSKKCDQKAGSTDNDTEIRGFDGFPHSLALPQSHWCWNI